MSKQKTSAPKDNWAKGKKKKLDDKQLALKEKKKFDDSNKGKKEVFRKHPTSPRCLIVTYEIIK